MQPPVIINPPNRISGFGGGYAWIDSSGGFTSVPASGQFAYFTDDVFMLKDNSDTTKKLQFQLSGITSGNTRTLTVPDATDTIVVLAATQTLTNKTLTSPTLTTPSLGVATATSINKVTITAPATSATLTIADGASLITSGAYAVTFTATGVTGVTLPTTGILATLAGTEELTNKTLTSSVGKGTWTASGTWTLPAHTLGGTVSGGGNQVNNVIIGASTPLAGSFTSVTFSTNAISTTALATPSALSATQFTGFASTVSGASLMGYGTTNDVTLMNRAGTVVLGVTANTTGVTMAGALAITGALTGVTTLTTSGAINSQTISSAANFTGTLTTADKITITTNGLTVSAGGATVTAGNLGIGAAVSSARAINIPNTYSLSGSGTTQVGVFSAPTFGTDATVAGISLYARHFTASGSYTMADGYGVLVEVPSVGATGITNLYGMRINNYGNAAVTNAYGLYIVGPTNAATTNKAIYASGRVDIDANIGTGGVGFAGSWTGWGGTGWDVGLGISPNNGGTTTSTNSFASIYSTVNGTFNATVGNVTTGRFESGGITISATKTITTLSAIAIGWNAPTVTGTLVNAVGLTIASINGGGTNSYGINVSAVNGTSTNYGIYINAPTGGSANWNAWFNGGSVVLNGGGALATNATTGFVYIPTSAGAPTGVPVSVTGAVAMQYDTTNNKLYVYNGAWKSVTLA